MTDARLVEGFLTNPKIDVLTDAAFRTYVNGLVFSVSAGTDGLLAERALRLLHPDGARADVVSELVDGRLWEPVASGWRIHDFLKHQTKAEQVERSRELARLRKERERQKKADDDLSRVTGRVTDDATPKDRTETGKALTTERTAEVEVEPDDDPPSTAARCYDPDCTGECGDEWHTPSARARWAQAAVIYEREAG